LINLGIKNMQTIEQNLTITLRDGRKLGYSIYGEIFVNAVREGFRPGSRGVAQDDILITQEWGFDLATIKPRIDIWHGEADVNVPIGAARYLQNTLPHTRATFLPGEGHFLLLKNWWRILSELIT
jgi:pimeloyl-ACP methyl ester carboxylesterase